MRAPVPKGMTFLLTSDALTSITIIIVRSRAGRRTLLAEVVGSTCWRVGVVARKARPTNSRWGQGLTTFYWQLGVSVESSSEAGCHVFLNYKLSDDPREGLRGKVGCIITLGLGSVEAHCIPIDGNSSPREGICVCRCWKCYHGNSALALAFDADCKLLTEIVHLVDRCLYRSLKH